MIQETIINTATTSSKKREDIINAGATLFARFGVGKTTMEEIARTANVAKGTLYKYFHCKEEVFSALVDRVESQLIEEIRRSVDAVQSPIDKIRVFILAGTKKLRELMEFYSVTQPVGNELWPLIVAEERKRYRERQEELMRKILTDGVASGAFDLRDPGLAAHTLLNALSGLQFDWALANNDEELHRQVELLLNVMLRGIVRR